MVKYKYVSNNKAIKGCNLLKENIKTRIPSQDIDKLTKELEENLIII